MLSECLYQTIVSLRNHPVVLHKLAHNCNDLMSTCLFESLVIHCRELTHELLRELARVLCKFITLKGNEGSVSLSNIQVTIGISDHFVD